MTQSGCPIVGLLYNKPCNFLFSNGVVTLIADAPLVQHVCCNIFTADYPLYPTPPDLLTYMTWTGESDFNGWDANVWNVTTDLGLHNIWTRDDSTGYFIAFQGPTPFPTNPVGWAFFDAINGPDVGAPDPSVFELPSDCSASPPNCPFQSADKIEKHGLLSLLSSKRHM
jgi:hypothetical protein